MLVHLGTEAISFGWSECVACVGTFDGVHVGHQTLVRTAQREAEPEGLPTLVVTFDRHPLAVLQPERKPLAIDSLDGNLKNLAELGTTACVVLHFDRALADTSAQRFLEEILLDELHVKTLVVGHDFALGKGREGTAQWLSQRVPTVVVPPVHREGVRVSSSTIRERIATGSVASVLPLLGRPYALPGVVVRGLRLGRELGYPTANLAIAPDRLTPADGVYAGICRTPFGTFGAAISIGVRPTVGGTHRTFEAHLLDYSGESLYGHPVRLEFHDRLRSEAKFESLDDLVRQMERDVLQARAIIATAPTS